MKTHKPTDVQVAKALGWKQVRRGGDWKAPYPHPVTKLEFCAVGYPRFTTDLSTIVAEVEARGLKVIIQIDKSGVIVDGLGRAVYEIGTHPNRGAMAVCRALLQHLKENP